MCAVITPSWRPYIGVHGEKHILRRFMNTFLPHSSSRCCLSVALDRRIGRQLALCSLLAPGLPFELSKRFLAERFLVKKKLGGAHPRSAMEPALNHIVPEQVGYGEQAH